MSTKEAIVILNTHYDLKATFLPFPYYLGVLFKALTFVPVTSADVVRID